MVMSWLMPLATSLLGTTTRSETSTPDQPLPTDATISIATHSPTPAPTSTPTPTSTLSMSRPPTPILPAVPLPPPVWEVMSRFPIPVSISVSDTEEEEDDEPLIPWIYHPSSGNITIPTTVSSAPAPTLVKTLPIRPSPWTRGRGRSWTPPTAASMSVNTSETARRPPPTVTPASGRGRSQTPRRGVRGRGRGRGRRTGRGGSRGGSRARSQTEEQRSWYRRLRPLGLRRLS